MKKIYNFELPTPNNISLFWNMGSLLGLCLMIQIMSGLFLTMNYCADSMLAFDSVIKMMRNKNHGWLLRTIHANGASFFFIILYFHVGRGLYYYSFFLMKTWIIGVFLLIISMGTAFLGYVLPWGQMSFWGASVITSLFSAIPYFGIDLVQWIWSGFSINNATLTRFFTIHFFLPFLIIMMAMIHLMFLHSTGSSNPLGMSNNYKKISFYPLFLYKDFMGFLIILFLLLIIIFYFPFYLNDPDNFILANPLITPIHIQPEWYFLFAYAILRSIPNKLGGVIALFFSILIFAFLPLMNNSFKFKSNQFYPFNKFLYWMLISIIFLLSWIGMRTVEMPYIIIGQIFTFIYFFIFFIYPMTAIKIF